MSRQSRIRSFLFHLDITSKSWNICSLCKGIAKMIIYHDLFTDDEIITDSFKLDLQDDFYYKVTTKYTTEQGTLISDAMIGGNASAEECQEQLDEPDVKRGYEVCLTHNLVEDNFSSAKDFKKQMKKIIGKSKEKLDPDYFSGEFKEKILAFVEQMSKEDEFKKWQIFFGPNAIDHDRIACPIFLKCSDDGMEAEMRFLKDFMYEEKA